MKVEGAFDADPTNLTDRLLRLTAEKRALKAVLYSSISSAVSQEDFQALGEAYDSKSAEVRRFLADFGRQMGVVTASESLCYL